MASDRKDSGAWDAVKVKLGEIFEGNFDDCWQVIKNFAMDSETQRTAIIFVTLAIFFYVCIKLLKAVKSIICCE